MIDLCIPTYNESAVIGESIRAVERALQGTSHEWRIIVADNGSTDGTADIVEALHRPRVRVLSIKERGKGAAIIAAARTSDADLFGFIDADLSADPRDLGAFVRLITDDTADIVIGSRLIDTRLVRRSFLRSLTSRLFNLLRKSILGIHVVDSQCGLKVMNARSREMLAQCTEKGWFLDLEFLRRAEIAGLSIREIPVHWNEEQLAGHASKLRVVPDALGALRAMVRIRRIVKRRPS